MKTKLLLLTFVLIFAVAFSLTACGSQEATPPASTGDSVNNNNNPPAEGETATYRYVDPEAAVSISKIVGTEVSNENVLTAKSDSAKVKKIIDLVNAGVNRQEPTKSQDSILGKAKLTGVSIKFSDGSIVNVYPVYRSFKNGKLSKPSKDLYYFVNKIGNNTANFTISSKETVKYLLKDLEKDFK